MLQAVLTGKKAIASNKFFKPSKKMSEASDIMINLKKPGGLQAYAGIIFLVFLLVLEDLLLVAFMSLIFGKNFWRDFTHSRLVRTQTVTYISLLYLIVLITIIGFWKAFIGEPLAKAGMRLHKKWIFEFAMGIITGLVAIVIFFTPLVLLKIALVPPHTQIIKKVVTMKFWTHITLNCLVCLAMAFTEEFFFRGVILHMFLRNVTRFHSLIAANTLFGLCHIFIPGPWSMKIMYFITLLLFGIGLSIAVLQTEALWLAIGIHFTLIFFVIIKGTLGILEIVRGPWEFLYGVNGHPMAGLWSMLLFTGMIAVLYRKGVSLG